MWNYLLMCLCLLSVSVKAQELEVIALSAPESMTYEDLGFLQQELQGKDIVLLGEQTHMYGTFFQTKARLVEYLHQELGFTTLAIEAPMYDLWKMNQKDFDKTAFQKSVWGVWGSSKEFQRLVDYIAEHDLKVIGFDSQIIDTDSFIEDLLTYCKENQISIPGNTDDFIIVLEGLLDSHKIDESDLKYLEFEEALTHIISQIQAKDSSTTQWYWNQFVKGVLASAQSAYYTKDIEGTSDLAMSLYNIRDKQMADNLIQYAQRYPLEKIMGWGDNVHMMYSNPESDNVSARSFVSMGFWVKKALTNTVYSLGTLHANDSVYDRSQGIWFKTPIKKGSFEDQLTHLESEHVFVSSKSDYMKKPIQTRLLHFIDFSKERLDFFHDGYIFCRKAQRAQPVYSENLSQTQSSASQFKEPTMPIQEASKADFTGRILDKKTGMPVAYATVYSKTDAIYRVSDLHGYFQIPQEIRDSNKLLNIESLGYDEVELVANTLEPTLYMEPNYEVLPELVLTARPSAKQVLKNVIANRVKNYPIDPFNYSSYYHIEKVLNDQLTLDLEFTSKEYSRGYQSLKGETALVEQVKWSVKPETKERFSMYLLLPLRMNAVRYSNMLHKRKYKKFTLSFIDSQEFDSESTYVIYFEIDRHKWNFTNKSYPTQYSGKIFIDKESFAVLKIEEYWEGTLDEQEIKTYFKNDPSVVGLTQMVVKEENVNYYQKSLATGRYYPAGYFYRKHMKFKDDKGIEKQTVHQIKKTIKDITLQDVQELPFEWQGLTPIRNTDLNAPEYDTEFWQEYSREIQN